MPAPSGFKTFSLAPELLRAVKDMGFNEPRPIQRAALPKALAGGDVLGLAQTGTGKTAAFALPILQRLIQAGPGRRRGQSGGPPAPTALVIAPTRELAAQIHAELCNLGKFTNMRSTTLFGGIRPAPQLRALQARPDVVVACPGRLLDLVGQKALSLGSVETLVLDEADHMFDMGFLPDLRRILGLLPKRRQNLMFSATMPREVRKLAHDVLRSPLVVELEHERPPETIAHEMMPLAEGQKAAALEGLLRGADFRSAIVFLRTKRRAKKLAERLEKRGFRAVSLQGNLSQSRREKAMAGFRAGDYDVLVATDIAARGIDVAKVSHVVNFDLPSTPEHYTHRIGRTGRAEEQGRAITFATPEDAASVRAIERHLGSAIPRAAADGTRDLAHEAPLTRSDTKGPQRGRGQRPPTRPRRAPKAQTGRRAQMAPNAPKQGQAAPKRVESTRPAPTAPPKRQAPAAPPFGSGIDLSAGAAPARDRGAPRRRR